MSLTLLEDVRQSVIGAFQTAHAVSYSATKVNYPNLVVVDLEHQAAPFVSVELDLSAVTKAALGDSELLVPGVLQVYFYYRQGTGTLDAFKYTDSMNANLCMRQIGSVYYHAVKPIPVTTFPAWVGMLNYIKFDVSASCV
jgi:hypothetical protein